MTPVSKRQQAILQFIREHQASKGFAPTFREIGAAVGIPSTSVVSYNVKWLATNGYLMKTEHISRGLNITALGLHLIDMPAISKEETQPMLPIPAWVVVQDQLFAENEQLKREIAMLRRYYYRRIQELEADLLVVAEQLQQIGMPAYK